MLQVLLQSAVENVVALVALEDLVQFNGVNVQVFSVVLSGLLTGSGAPAAGEPATEGVMFTLHPAAAVDQFV